MSFCQNCISPSNSEANRDGADAESPFPLFFSFSASFKNSSPRKKVGNCLRFGTGGWSLCFYPLLSRNIWIFSPRYKQWPLARKKISGKAICSRHQRESALSRFGARIRYWIWLRGSASYVIKFVREVLMASRLVCWPPDWVVLHEFEPWQGTLCCVLEQDT